MSNISFYETNDYFATGIIILVFSIPIILYFLKKIFLKVLENSIFFTYKKNCWLSLKSKTWEYNYL